MEKQRNNGGIMEETKEELWTKGELWRNIWKNCRGVRNKGSEAEKKENKGKENKGKQDLDKPK